MNWVNSASGVISATDGSGIQLGGNWENEGTISATDNSVISIFGTCSTSDLGTITLSANSTFKISGTLNNTGSTFSPAIYGGTCELLYGTIVGGTLDLSGGSFDCITGTLDGVALRDGDLNLPTSQGVVFDDIQPGDGHAINVAGAVTFDGPSQTVGNLTINAEPNAPIYVSGADSNGPQTLTLASDVNVYGGTFAENHSGDGLVNNGTMDAGSPSAMFGTTEITINCDNFTNNNIAEATNGGLLNINSSDSTNSATGTIIADGPNSGVNLAAGWSNAGTIKVFNGGTVSLNGTFTTAQLGNIYVDSNSTLQIQGTWTNNSSNSSLQIDGNLIIAGGTIVGGTVDSSVGNLSVQDGTLDGVTVTGMDVLVSDYDSLYVRDGITITDQNLDVGQSASVYFDGPGQSIDNLTINCAGSGTIYPSGPNSNGPQTLTLGRNVTINGSVQLADNNTGDSIVNYGLVDADAPNQSIVVSVDNFINNGTLEATGAGTLQINNNLINNGWMKLNGGTLDIVVPGTYPVVFGQLNVGDGTLSGSGQIDGDLAFSSDPSTLAFELSSEEDFDSLAINGNVSLAGNLEISLADGFEPSSGDIFTVLTVDSGDTLTGSFDDVPDGGRLTTADGLGSFQVNYGSGPYTNEIVLSDFEQVPEPATGGLAVMALAGLLARRRRAIPK